MIIKDVVMPLINSYDKTFVGPVINTRDKDSDNNIRPPPSPSITPTISLTPTPTMTPTPSATPTGEPSGGNSDWSNPPVEFSFTVEEYTSTYVGTSKDFDGDPDAGEIITATPDYFSGFRISNDFNRTAVINMGLLLTDLTDVDMGTGTIELLDSSNNIIATLISEEVQYSIYEYAEGVYIIEGAVSSGGQILFAGETYTIRFIPANPPVPLVLDVSYVPTTGDTSTFYQGFLIGTGGKTGINEYSIWLNSLPPGLEFNPNYGFGAASIEGTPTTPGVYEVGFQVDSGDESDQEIVTITIS